MATRKRRVLFWVVIAAVAIQVVPAWLWQKNPPAAGEPAWDAPATRALAQRACFDCHSNATIWPAYARVAPVSWLVTSDVVRGRKALNFSSWAAHPVPASRGEEAGDAASEASKAVASGEMPPAAYRLIHAHARLTAAERDTLGRGLRRTLAGAAYRPDVAAP